MAKVNLILALAIIIHVLIACSTGRWTIHPAVIAIEPPPVIVEEVVRAPDAGSTGAKSGS